MNHLAAIKSRIDSFYEIISGTTGQVRDWDKMRSLFIPGAYVVICLSSKSKGATATVMGIDTYIENLARFLRDNDFHEIGIIHRTEIFGNIASVISTYEARHSPDEKDPMKRGVNFIHLCQDSGAWLITSMIWRDEDEECPLPEKYR
ncbi:MAG: hypothetical protein JSV52_03230 [Candidatus Zixiibacteriota bacterium]|nr:MAG: hypothetical protein JSV52_03230 [candidate division Zixibacteria bacterium]